MKKKFTAALLAALMTLSLTVTASAAFVDVPWYEWFYDDVTAVEKYGIINGVGGGRFAPDQSLSLAEAVTMACRADAVQQGLDDDDILDQYAAATGEIPGSWFQPYALYANVNGICALGEYGYDYDAPCSRLIMAKLFSQVVWQPYQLNRIDTLPDCADADVLYLYNQGILTGNDEYGTFNPNSNVTRAEAAAIINRVMDPDVRHAFALHANTRALSDFLGMTVGEIAAQHGWQFTLVDGWWYGASKAMGHPAFPFTMLVTDPNYQLQSFGDLTGREVISMVQCSSEEPYDAVPNLAMDLTLQQLRNRCPNGQLQAGNDFFSDDGAIAQYSVQYGSNLYLAYQWYTGNPYTDPAEWVVVART